MKILLENVRIAFAHGLFEARSIQGSKPRFSAVALIDKTDTKAIDKVISAMKAVAQEKWKEKGTQMYAVLEKQDRLALHDGSTKPDYEGYEESMFINVGSQFGPNTKQGFVVLGRDRAPIGPDAGIIYSGCYVNMSIEVWAQDRKDEAGKRINAALKGVQFVRDGDAFSGSSAASADEFPDIADNGECTEEDAAALLGN